jgi:hypothetical protein
MNGTSLAFWKNLQWKAEELTNLLLGYKRSILRGRFENEPPSLGTVKISLGMRCMSDLSLQNGGCKCKG